MSAPDAVVVTAVRWRVRAVVAVLVAAGLVLVGFVAGKFGVRAETIAVAEPSAAQLRAVADTRVFFGHQSVGSNLLGGLAALTAETDENGLQVLETRDAVAGGGFLAHAHVGVNGDPQSKFDDFAAVIDGALGESLDVALLKLCYTDVTAGTDVEAVFSVYEDLLADLQERHPDITFLYATVPVTTDRGLRATISSWLDPDDAMGPTDNIARHRFNELVRERFAGSGRLFDIAAVEAAMSQAPTRRLAPGGEYYVLHPAFSSDPGHLNEAGSRAVAAEFVRLVAEHTAGP